MTRYRAILSYNRRHRVEIEFEASDDEAAANLHPAIEIWARAAISRADNADGYIVIDRLDGDALVGEVGSFDLDEGCRGAPRAPLPRALRRGSVGRARLRRRSRPA